MVGTLLREVAMPPSFRSAVYRFAASIPDVELIGDATDNAGRSGVVVGKDMGTIRYELILNPETGDLLEEREVVISEESGSPAAVGTILSTVTYLTSGIVSSTAERP
jgi:hypothetical protein